MSKAYGRDHRYGSADYRKKDTDGNRSLADFAPGITSDGDDDGFGVLDGNASRRTRQPDGDIGFIPDIAEEEIIQ